MEGPSRRPMGKVAGRSCPRRQRDWAGPRSPGWRRCGTTRGRSGGAPELFEGSNPLPRGWRRWGREILRLALLAQDDEGEGAFALPRGRAASWLARVARLARLARVERVERVE